MNNGSVQVIKMQNATQPQGQVTPLTPNVNMPLNQGVVQQTPSLPLPQLNGFPTNYPNPQSIPPQSIPDPSTPGNYDIESSISSGSSSDDDDDASSTSSYSSNASASTVSSDSSGVENGKKNGDIPLSGGASEDDTSSISTADILSKDPLFLVLSEFLMDEEGTNIVTMLGRINKSLKALKSALKGQTKDERKRNNKKR